MKSKRGRGRKKRKGSITVGTKIDRPRELTGRN